MIAEKDLSLTQKHMKLMNVKFIENNEIWYSEEYLPDNRRDVLIYTPESGTSVGFHTLKGWWDYKWDEYVDVKFWRELPRYNGNNSSL